MPYRESGVLLNISSLPGRYGIGKFGSGAVAFAARIADMGFTRWQVLPFSQPGLGDSPYASESAFAGNILYISPDMLAEDGYITAAEARECVYNGSPYETDYAFARESVLRLLKKAFGRLTGSARESFYPLLPPEKQEYCRYMALKEKHSGKPFTEWGPDLDCNTADSGGGEHFHAFAQCIFEDQWQRTKKRINELGVKIIGDIPMYVSSYSADLWAHRRVFRTEGDFSLSSVAGAPPDYFSADGQLWGNPLYDWEYLASTGYEWWVRRIISALNDYDTLRIDHFRGLASYWAVPAGETTARNGRWEKGPGQALFDALNRELPGADIIAEDLGGFGEDVESLLRSTGYAGMRIIQFGFDNPADGSHLPHNYPVNSVAYTGTHDNDTLLGWLYAASPEVRSRALRYCSAEDTDWGRGGPQAPACRRIIETVWRSPSFLTVLPVQDMCGFGGDARMNRPGVPSGQWRFRLTDEFLCGIDADWFRNLNRTFRRTGIDKTV